MAENEVPYQKGADEFCRSNILLNSPGIWNVDGVKGFFSHALPRLQFQLASIFLLTHSLHVLLKRLHIPRIVPEFLAGLILGPTLLPKINSKFASAMFPQEGEVFLDGLARIGYIFFMFLIGVKMDPSMVFKTGIKAWIIGIFSILLPTMVGMGASNRLDPVIPRMKLEGAKTVVAIQTLTPFPVIACLLIDLKIMNSELGRLALASTLISDLVSTATSTILANLSLSHIGYGNANVIHSFFLATTLVLIIVFVIRPMMLWIVKQTPEGKPIKGFYTTFVSFMVLALAIISDNMGLQYHFGPFIFGLCVPSGPPLGSTLVDKLDTVISGLLAPLVVTSCALRFSIFEIFDTKFVRSIWKIIAAAVSGKLVTIFFVALPCKVPIKDAAALSIIMSAQGIVELASYLNIFVNQTIDGETFASLGITVMIVATCSRLLVRFIYDYSRMYTGYQKRDILHSPSNAELRIVACSHRKDDALAAIKLLEVSNPTRESPIAAYALHLVALIGRASPLLIHHRLGQNDSSRGSRSQQIIDVFRYYEQQYSGLVGVQVYTAMSLPMFMQHDICSMAFDKLASLIILPFHRKWNQQGKVILDNNVLRTINLHVLDMAPCSVGILVDRRKLHQAPSNHNSMVELYRVAVVFLGGDDDREALAYGKRMARASGVHLTVVRFFACNDLEEDQWQVMLDSEMFGDIRLQASMKQNIVYREEKVKDGSETALVVRKMDEFFDLIITGRRHRDDSLLLSGLTEWIELSELGPIGDILASSDIDKPVSVLIVQQQLVQVK